MRDKRLVARQFSRAANSYDSAAEVQRYALEQLLDLIPTQARGHWLDIGCGTGSAVPLLLHRGAEHVTGVDMASGMLDYARQHHSQMAADWLLADADQVPLATHSASGILSSLMLQWSEDPTATLREWYRLLVPGGYLAVATLLPGTHEEIRSAWQAINQRPHVNRFCPQQTLREALSEAGFTLQTEHQQQYQQCFQDVTTLLRSLKAIGATNVNPGRASGLGGRQALRQLEQHYPSNSLGQYPLSYHIYWWLARKEK
ncbi:malonyl-ACP O-methyltransferase BioC [Bacterioplanes sanyensis]|nr:malonyl-ACP O-methyltransferase BioC [Bacterioplanes sanyensis]